MADSGNSVKTGKKVHKKGWKRVVTKVCGYVYRILECEEID